MSALKVSSLPGALGEPSNASRAAEISPREINVSASANLFSSVSHVSLLLWRNCAASVETSTLSRRRFNHRPSANWVNRSGNFFFGTLLPLAGLCRRRPGRKKNNFQPLETAEGCHDSLECPRTPNVHISGPRRFKHTTKIPRKDPPRGREE